jgi:flagellar hook assembly protein FlgD
VDVIADGLPCYQQPQGLQGVEPSFVPDEGGLGSFVVLGPQVAEAWDGKASTGQLVASGTYMVIAEVSDAFGHTTTFTTQLTVVRVDSSVKIDIYNGAGELVRHLDVQGTGATSSGVSLEAPALSSGSSVTIDYGSGKVAWDGTNDTGSMVQSGEYLVKVTKATGKGEVQVFTQAVTLLDSPDSSLDGAYAAPNPLLAGDQTLTIWLPASAAGMKVKVEIYDLAGEKTAETVQANSSGHITLDLHGTEASGIYLVRLTSRDGRGTAVSKTLKIALIR